MTEGVDYTILPDGRLVFTAKYLLERGFCCGNGCLNCPYEYINVPELRRTELINSRLHNDKK
ncbi:MAG: DUF5522 domain-containing protein [Flavipsychrobacter sp.]|nr:DUF5522 domain-containing protein [Flavipsychrobacter sp.]